MSKSGKTLAQLLELNDSQLKDIVYPLKNNYSQKYKTLKPRIPDNLKSLSGKNENLLHQWELYKKENSVGYSYSQFCNHVLRAQSMDVKAEAVFQYEFGDLLFVDYAGDPVIFTEFGKLEKEYWVFVSILPASQKIYAGISERKTTQDWVEQTTRALEYFNGVPAAIVPDCDTAVVKKANKYQAELTHQYQKFSEHYNTVVVPARPYSPRDKALVENAVNNIYRHIYPRLKDRTCYTLNEFEKFFLELVKEFNNRNMRRFDKSRNEMFEEFEKGKLKELPETRFLFQKYQSKRTVGKSSHIYLKEDGVYYSVPYRYINQNCDIYYTEHKVNIFYDNKFICSHIRHKGRGKYVTATSHLTRQLQGYFEWTEAEAIRRGNEYNESIGLFIKGIFQHNAHALQARKQSYGVFDLTKKYGSSRVTLASKMVLRESICKYGILRNILENGIERAEETQTGFEYDITHNNLRYTNMEIKNG